MRSRTNLCWLVVVAVGLIPACGPGAEESGPGGAVQRFYRHLNDGDYATAKALYNAETRKMLDDPDLSSEEGFREWAAQQTRDGSISRVEILSAEIAGDEARVEFEIRFRDGSTQAGQVTAKLEDGEWKLGFLG